MPLHKAIVCLKAEESFLSLLRHFVSLVNHCVLHVCALVNARAGKCDCPVNILCSVISAHAVLDGHTLFNYGSRSSKTRRKVRLGCKLAVRVWLVKFLSPPKLRFCVRRNSSMQKLYFEGAGCTASGGWTIGPSQGFLPQHCFLE